MNAKRIAAALALACVLVLTGAAQAGKAANNPIITIDNGYVVGFNFTTAVNDIGSGFDFTIGLGVTDNLQVLVTNITGDANLGTYRMLGFCYSLAPKLGIETYIGQKSAGTAPTGSVAGLGLFANVFEREVGDLTTAFKLRLDYIAPLSAYDSGVIRAALMASIGI